MEIKLLTVISLCLLFSVYPKSNAQELLYKKHAPEQLKEDLLFFIETSEKIHPNLYHSVSRETIASYRRELESKIVDSMTTLDFGRLVIPLSTKFMDGHTSLWFPYNDVSKAYSEIHRFPLEVKIIGRQLFVKQNNSNDSSIRIWDEIIEINGQKSDKLIEELLKYKNGELEHWRLSLIENGFARDLWLIKGWENKFELLINSGGQMIPKTINGILGKDLRSKSGSSSRPSNYTLSFIDDRVGLINFRSMINTKMFKKFLDSTFQVLNERGTEHLIIDIRQNGGGSSTLGKLLLKYFSDESFKQSEKTVIKTSEISKKLNRKKMIKWYMYPLYPIALLDKSARAALIKSNGSITEISGSSSRINTNKKNRFKGKVYLLTGHRTFSSAGMLASAFSCFNMGVVIGEETGQPLISFGELTYIKLPNTRADAWASCKSFIMPCADSTSTKHGVVPDYEVIPTIADLKKGRDTVLEFTLDLINNSSDQR